jgi:hypothetical protein
MSRKVFLTAALWAVSQIAIAGVPEARALWIAGDYRHAFAEAAEPANQGDREAQFMLGEAYRLGRSVEPNPLIAEDWYTRAAKQGHVGAATELGLLYAARHAWTSALPWLAFAASNNEPRGMATLAALYYNGDGVPRDEAAAVSLMTQAAALGLPEARERLRLMGSPEPEVVATVQMMPPSPIVESAPVRTASTPVPAASAPVRVASTPAPVASAPVRIASAPVPQPESNKAPRMIAVPSERKPVRVVMRASGRFRVQVGAYRSYARAERAWTIMRHKVGMLTAAQHVIIRSGSLYRLQVVAYSAPAARALSASLNSARWPSFVHRTSHTA